MVNNTLVDLLKSLNKEELILLEDFLNSPYFNKKKNVVHLFNYLKNLYPDFDGPEKLSRKKIYQELYPDKPYNYGVLKNIIYDLNMLGEKFLELSRYNENKPEHYRHLLAELTKRNLKKSFKKNLKNAELILRQSRRDDMYFRNKMDIELLKFNFHITRVSRTEKPGFDLKANSYLISYFLSKFFKINYNNLVTRDNFGTTEDIGFLNEVLNYVRNNAEIDPVILIYYNAFMLIYTENESVYREYKKVVKEQINNLGQKELFNSYNNFLNYCYGKIASGEWEYYKELFSLHNEMIANNILTVSENDFLDSVHFRLAAETGTRLEKFDWVNQFIKQFSEKLNPKFRDNEINLAMANLHFMKKNYDEAQKYISQTQVYSAYDKVYIYIIQSMIHYERKQFENLISEVDAIKHFIMNDKSLWVESRNSFKKYVDYLNELVKLNFKNPGIKAPDIKMLRNRLMSETGILDKRWLLEKLDEFNSG